MTETFLITGSRGFIGSRLVRHVLDMGHGVRALVRRGPGSERTRAGYEEIRGDVTDAESVDRAARGCSVVFHCAFGGTTLADSRRINVEGTRNVVVAAARAGARRVVHLSSLAVHGQALPPVLTEDFPLTTVGSAYDVSKAEGERAAFESGSAHGIEVVALRPTLVYGPGAPLWVRQYFTRVKRERVALLNDGAGLANLIFVDDLVEAMWLAAHRPGIGGEAFLMSGAAPATWREYLGSFARMCGKPDPPTMPAWRARWGRLWYQAYAMLTEREARVTRTDVDLMPQRCRVSIAKAQERLGFEPKVDLKEGMRRCEIWLRTEGLMPTRPAAFHSVVTLLQNPSGAQR